MPGGDQGLDLEWGRIPRPVLELVEILSDKAAKDSARLRRMEWPDGPQDVQDLLGRALSDAHKVTRASADLRSLLTAYAHRFHQPRPRFSELARAQDATSQGLNRRYSETTVSAISSLLSSEPDLQLIRNAFPSVSPHDLGTMSGAVGDMARSLREARKTST